MVQSIQAAQQRNNYRKLALSAGAGAIAGAGLRYLIPTKKEFNGMINKPAFDAYISNTAIKARGAERSIIKFGGIGALIAAGIVLLSKIFSKHNTFEKTNLQYSKYGALVDAPDYAVEVMWYGE